MGLAIFTLKVSISLSDSTHTEHYCHLDLIVSTSIPNYIHALEWKFTIYLTLWRVGATETDASACGLASVLTISESEPYIALTCAPIQASNSKLLNLENRGQL